eukprot:355210-Chlamydomonas_euryale.AAC.1
MHPLNLQRCHTPLEPTPHPSLRPAVAQDAWNRPDRLRNFCVVRKLDGTAWPPGFEAAVAAENATPRGRANGGAMLVAQPSERSLLTCLLARLQGECGGVGGARLGVHTVGGAWGLRKGARRAAGQARGRAAGGRGGARRHAGGCIVGTRALAGCMAGMRAGGGCAHGWEKDSSGSGGSGEYAARRLE